MVFSFPHLPHRSDLCPLGYSPDTGGLLFITTVPDPSTVTSVPFLYQLSIKSPIFDIPKSRYNLDYSFCLLSRLLLRLQRTNPLAHLEKLLYSLESPSSQNPPSTP